MSDLYCASERRRKAVREAPEFGLDYVELSDSPRCVHVFFLGRAPKQIHAVNVQISGGRRIRGIRVTTVRVHRQKDLTLDDWMEVHVDQTGDFSAYTLRLVKTDEQGRPTGDPMQGFDPLYSSVDFSFKAGCPTDLDCKQAPLCPPPQRTQPDINYLAKDFNSFRQLIFDRLALTMPNWKETHVPDIGYMLVELLAYAGDYLSYYQDAVATEAYLGTARQRISVGRHARLIDYRMHEGCNARAWITIASDTDTTLDPRQVFFTTALPGSPDQHVFEVDDLQRIPPESYEIFEPLVADRSKPIPIYQAHSEIHFYTWGDTECCLAKGATSATLVDHWLPVPGGKNTATADGTDGPPRSTRALRNLAVDDVLIFEEVIGPVTGNSADADPSHRQAVRLTKVTPNVDPLYHPTGRDYGQPVVEIEWCFEDALTFALCISARMPAPDCTIVKNVSVARGNVVLVDHGAGTGETPLGTVPTESTVETCACDCEPPHTETVPGRFCPVLKGRPLTFAELLPPCGCAVTLLDQDPRQALPEVSLTGTRTTPQGDVITAWSPKSDLLESGSVDASFVVEIDNDGNAHLRFGDGDLGRIPEAGTVFDAVYRIGNGSAGNVGAETITCIVFRRGGNRGKLAPRNPLAAVGGTDPETIEDVKLIAPGAFRRVIERAITADDYAALASDDARRFAERPSLERQALAVTIPPPVTPEDRDKVEEESGDELTIVREICHAPLSRLQGAKARLQWTGSWYEVLVAIDPLGAEDVDDELIEEIGAYLDPYRRIGHDVKIQQAQYVGIDLALRICVLPEYLRGHVKAALLDVLGNRLLPDGTKGLFHRDNLTFGDGIYASRIIAAAQAVTGVRSVELARLERFEIGEPALGVESAAEEIPAGGVLELGPFEIARLDNDPNYPENGRLTLVLEGGR
jgi:hypothetical protein